MAKLAFFVLTLSIAYAFIYPGVEEISVLTGEKEKYENSLAMVGNIEAKKNELITQLNGIPEEERKNIDTVLPDSLNFVRLISQIDAVAAKYGISIGRISSKEMTSSVGGSIAEAGPSKPYETALLGFSFESSYEKFNQFLSDLEKSMRVLDIKTVKLDTTEKGIYNYTVEFETYWLNPSK